MPQVISIHSFRGGTGKSNIAANVAAILATEGRRVGVIDTDIQVPGIHVIFGLAEKDILRTLNDYLWGKCEIRQTAHDVTPKLRPAISGKIFLVPSSIKMGEIARILREGYDAQLLTLGLAKLIDELALDALVIDTHPGLNEETLFSIALSTTLAIVLRPDQQDYQGTGITIKVARQLQIPHMWLVINRLPAVFDPQKVQAQVEQTYQCPAAIVVPHSDDIMTLASSGVFALRYPDHPVTALYKQLASKLIV